MKIYATDLSKEKDATDQVLLICGKWTLLIFKEIIKFSTLPCVSIPEVKKVESHVLMKTKYQSSNKLFSVESHVIKLKIKHRPLSFLVITAGSRPKLFPQLICWTMTNLHHKQPKPGKEMFLLTPFINTTLITDLLLKNTENISQSLKMDFSMFLEESQSISTNWCLVNWEFNFKFSQKDQFLMSYKMKQVKTCGSSLFHTWQCLFTSVLLLVSSHQKYHQDLRFP